MTQPLMATEHTGAERVGIHKGGIRQKYILDDVGRHLLIAKYDGTQETIDELMALHFTARGIPRHKVKLWASAMGLARQKEPRWTQDELDYLERNLHRSSLGAIAKHLGRTKTAVRIKAKRIGVNKCGQEGYTMRGLCLGLGCDHHKVQRWLEKGWLKGRRRATERTAQQGGDVWLFSDAAIRAFIKAHPEEIDQRRMDWLWVVDLLASNTGLGVLGSEGGVS